MNIDDVKALMKETGWGTLATTDGETVGVRPMAGWAWMDDELWCASGKTSDKINQLMKVTHAEYCFCNQEGKHARIAGECSVSTDNDDKLKLFKAVPLLKNYIEDPADPEYVVIRMKPDCIRIMATTDLEYEEVALK
ncbi:MAG: pyridoxamine 5'-phosphate oxidase family protein [Planctomycetota bacterium]|nr:MAG: pyridoxamine 5'-phosphate oxidase family protein [Planctomycetota bacterium]